MPIRRAATPPEKRVKGYELGLLRFPKRGEAERAPAHTPLPFFPAGQDDHGHGRAVVPPGAVTPENSNICCYRYY